MSGGVDSAVAALLLRRQGMRVTGVFMKNWEEDDQEGYCAAAEDLRSAEAVCRRLDIPLRTVNFSSEYWERVFARFLEEYRCARTPNPDVLCNTEIKFNAFLEHALSLGADGIATGHYAGVGEREGNYMLLKAKDAQKDQTYFLHGIGQKELEKTLFPLAGLNKAEVRAIARDAGLPNPERPDSTGICFIGERPFKTFLKRFLPAEPGDILSIDGHRKGRHDGLMYYTIGQRHGLGVGGPGGPWYVAGKDTDKNILYVVEGGDHPALYSGALMAGPIHWVSGKPPELPLYCSAKTRYRQPDQKCRVEPLDGARVRVVFDRPQRAVTPGQYVVFYSGTICLGGGIIDTALAAADEPASREAQPLETADTD